MIVCLSLVIILYSSHFRYHRNIIIAGGYYYDGDFSNAFYDDILEYVHNEDSIQAIGNMIQARASHAVSVVQVKDYSMWCQ